MNILIFEYITGGGLVGETLPASLVGEGELMLNTVSDDLSELDDVQVSVMRDYRLQSNKKVKYEYIVDAKNGFADVIECVSKTIDALLIIAPESEGILSTLCEKYSNREFIMLNSTSRCVALVSDKLKTYKYLKCFNIPQIPTYEMSDVKLINSDKIIIKPKDGVGCERIHLLEISNNSSDVVNQFDKHNYIAQPYIQGQSASLSLLCWDGKCKLLSVNVQNIEEIEDGLELKGCVVNALEHDRFVEFSNSLIKTLPDLRGYVGVDILISKDKVLLVEVNPRLTTSYAGLSSALDVNPAGLILQTFIDQKLPEFFVSQETSITVNIGAEHAA